MEINTALVLSLVIFVINGSPYFFLSIIKDVLRDYLDMTILQWLKSWRIDYAYP
jgi:hypothetical protein